MNKSLIVGIIIFLLICAIIILTFIDICPKYVISILSILISIISLITINIMNNEFKKLNLIVEKNEKYNNTVLYLVRNQKIPEFKQKFESIMNAIDNYLPDDKERKLQFKYMLVSLVLESSNNNIKKLIQDYISKLPILVDFKGIDAVDSIKLDNGSYNYYKYNINENYDSKTNSDFIWYYKNKFFSLSKKTQLDKDLYDLISN